uniref:P-type Ca(2+) transporter n=1 Tax=Plectus sambesii TaxID=2011161 RepID=A0A914WZ25_9BILA
MASTSGQWDYGCSVNDLRNLMEYRGTEGKTKIQSDYGDTEGLCMRLKTDSINGIPNTTEELERRRAFFGTNEISLHPPKGFCPLVREALKDVTLILLLVDAIISLALSFYRPPHDITDSGGSYERFIESLAILITVILVVLVTALSDYTKERKFRGLQSKLEMGHRFSVIHGGTQLQVAVSELVVGDIAQIKNGNLLPADGILIASNDLKIDESSLTGESDQIEKNPDSDPMLLSGTHVVDGSGKMLMTAMGVNSQSGITMTLLGPRNTTVEEVRKAAKREAVFFVLLLFTLQTVRFIIEIYIEKDNSFFLSHVVYIIIFALVSILLFVYALPLALPFALVLIWRQRGWYAARLRRFIQYQFTVNGVATFIAFITAILIQQYVVSILQVLFINLIYGCLAAVALTVSTNHDETYLLSTDNLPILTRRLWVNIKGQAIYQAIILLILIFYGERLFDVASGRYNIAAETSVHFTLVFNAFVLMSIFNQTNARKVFGERNVFQNIHKDYLFVGIFILQLIIQALIVQIGCDLLRTTPLTYIQWLCCIAFAVGGLMWQQVIVSIPCRQ